MGVLRTGEASPKLIYDPPISVSPIGSYDDPNNFRAFAEQFSQAVENRDVDWFVENTRVVNFDCRPPPFSSSHLPPPQPPRTCEDESAPDAVPAVYIATEDYEGEDVDSEKLGFATWFGWNAGTDEYRDIIERFLNKFDKEHSDGYGHGLPYLHSYGLHSEVFGEDTQTIVAMTTTISKLSVRGNSVGFPRRLLVEFHVAYDGERWEIERLWYTPDNRFIAVDLDPASDLAKRESGDQQIWEFWQRWEPASTP